MCQFSDGLGDKRDIPVAYTFGQYLRTIGMFAALWTEMRTAIAFNREERTKLEKRIAELEQMPQISYNGIFAPEKQYKAREPHDFSRLALARQCRHNRRDAGRWHLLDFGREAGTGWKEPP